MSNNKKKKDLPFGFAKKIAKLFLIFADVISELELKDREIEFLVKEKKLLKEKLNKVILEIKPPIEVIKKVAVLGSVKTFDISETESNSISGPEKEIEFRNDLPDLNFTEIVSETMAGIPLQKEQAAEMKIVPAGEYPDLVQKIHDFYREVFEMEIDFSGIRIPERRRTSDWAYDRLLIVAEGMTFSKIFAGFQKFSHISVGFSDDLLRIVGIETKITKKSELAHIYREFVAPALDEIVRSARSVEKDYSLWVYGNLVNDKECDKISANQLNEKKVPTLSLEERMLHELFTLWEKGSGYYGRDNVSVCADSRFVFSEGHETVPKFGWYDGRIAIGWHSPSKISPNIRAHRVII